MSSTTTLTEKALPQIHREWVSRCYTAAARHRFDEWTAQYPALRGYELGELPLRLSALPRASADAIMHSLISLAQAGHSLAGLCVLEAFSPRIIALTKLPAVCAQYDDLNDRFAHVIAAAWEALGTYNLRLTSKVAANFSMNMLKYSATYAERKMMRHETSLSPEELDMAGILIAENPSAARPPSAESQIDVILDWAHQTGVINGDGISLIRAYYLTHTTHEARIVLAEELGIGRDALYQRVHRLLSRLQAALARHIKADNLD